MHSAKALQNVVLGKAHTAKKSVGKSRFAECFLSDIRQSLCRVQNEKSPKK
jgi:hypothetical protein